MTDPAATENVPVVAPLPPPYSVRELLGCTLTEPELLKTRFEGRVRLVLATLNEPELLKVAPAAPPMVHPPEFTVRSPALLREELAPNCSVAANTDPQPLVAPAGKLRDAELPRLSVRKLKV